MKKHLFLLFIPLALAFNIQAQDSTSKSPVQLSESQWKSVVGVYQSSQNNEMKVQFSVAEGGILLAKLLWNSGEVHLLPESPLAFTSKEQEDGEPIRVKFVKDSSGAVNQVEVAKNGVWTRVKNYQPEATKTVMTHTPDQLKPFEGIYHLQPDPYRIIQLSVKGNDLILRQGWDNNEISFSPDTQLSFFAPAIPRFSLEFVKDNAGNITQFTAFKRDVWIRAGKPTDIAGQLKGLAGKYKSKDDPDNELLFTPHGNQLVVKQLWDKKEIALDVLADGYFYNTADKYSVQLMKEETSQTQVLVLGMQVFIKEK